MTDELQLQRVRESLSEEEWLRRLAEADRQAAIAERVLERHRTAGESKRSAIRAEAPDDPETTWVARLKRYQAGGRDGLIKRNIPVRAQVKVTPEVVGLVRGLLQADPTMRSPAVGPELEALTGTSFGEASVRRAMRLAGVAQPKGRPAQQEIVEAHPLAGAELLRAVDLELGATEQMAAALHASLEQLPAPRGPVRDDSENRDELGRFLRSYNEPEERTEPELGEKFDSVELRRGGKDLRAMQVAQTSEGVLRRKLETLTLLPVVTDSPRFDGLRHWQGDHLEPLVGVGYMPATLDKFTRELKYAGASHTLQQSVASFWLGRQEVVSGPVQGAVLLYVDTAVKPVWTHHFSRCAKVSGNGRTMPATSTVFLHTGTGTPVLYRSYSGHASLPAEVLDLLHSYERIAGEGTARRLVVMDREAHAVWLMKALARQDLEFIVPLRKSVTGPSAQFEDTSEWVPYRDKGDEVCSARLLLNDSRDRKEPLWVRVVGRKRHRTGNVAWYATNAASDTTPNAVVIDTYFDRWPLQEHVFRDGNGRVHLDAHHGYGKLKIDNIAVLDKEEKLTGRLRKLEDKLASGAEQVEELQSSLEVHEQAVVRVNKHVREERARLDEFVTRGETATRGFQKLYASLRTWEPWLERTHNKVRELSSQLAAQQQALIEGEQRRGSLRHEGDRLAGRRRIFTIDVELDQIMTALKLTFMNLCAVFMSRYLGKPLQLDTLIRGVLTLPGERVLSPTTETIRIYRRERDRELMPLVEEACRLLTAKGLVRGKRRLRFEVVESPPMQLRRRREPGDDTG